MKKLTEEKKKSLPESPLPELPDPVEILDELDAAIQQVDVAVKQIDAKVETVELKAMSIDKRFSFARRIQKQPVIKKKLEEKPETGKTYPEQSNEAYCLECIEGHTMGGQTEMRHAIDRYRTAGKMTQGVTEKVRAAIKEIVGINEDVKNTEDASPEVKEGLNQILDEVRWIRKEFGISGRGLTRGRGDMTDLEELRGRITKMNLKAYELVEQCPSCKIMSRDLRHRMKEGGKTK